MESSRFESLTPVAAVIGAAIVGIGAHTAAAAVGDLAILLALFTLDGNNGRSGAQSLGFAGTAGLSLLSPVFFLASNILGATPPSESAPWMLVGAWAVATLIIFGVDRFRMSGRDNVGFAGSGLAGAAPVAILTSAPTTNYRPAPIRVEPPLPAAYTPPPAYAPPPPPMPTPPPTPSFVTEAPMESTYIPAAAVIPQIPDVTAIPPGREALIYLNLVGEGLNVLRTVRAENLGRDYFRIADIMPDGEQWEFTPGQVVKCRKKALSNGKHMVAFEEAPRAQ